MRDDTERADAIKAKKARGGVWGWGKKREKKK